MSSTQAQAQYVEFLGPLLIGVTGNAIVFGICCMQLITYIDSGYDDSKRLRFLIAWVYAIDTFQIWQSVSTLWHYTVANFDNPAALANGPWEYASLPIFGSLAIVPIQVFMALRIMRFANSKILFYVIAVGSVCQAALACSAATRGMIDTAVANHINIMPLADAWLGFAVLCDTTITGLLLFYLLKSRTGVRKTDSIIRRLCSTTIEAAVPVVLLSLGDLLALTISPTSNFHYMFALPVGRLYTNTLMVTLNDRKRLRTQLEHWSVNSIHPSKITSKPYPSNPKQPLPVLVVRTIDLLKSGYSSQTTTMPLSALSETSTEFSNNYAIANLEMSAFEPDGKTSQSENNNVNLTLPTKSWNDSSDLEKGLCGRANVHDDIESSIDVDFDERAHEKSPPL